ncbi:MAG: ABC transporter ATP-binding protein [Candidatus Thorarchaeota archaeon]|nr:ABC transporter ATP-binding protein [Candidatus Thorarchaeota archaeon]
MVEVEIIQMERQFRDGTRVGPISLKLEDGELMALLGPSGAGKTTTLRMVAGFIKPDSGRLLFDEQDVTFLNPTKRQIGMVFQSIALFPNMDVFHNIAFGLEMEGWGKDRIIERVKELAAVFGIDNLLERNIDEVSGGEAQRVALARAVAKSPRLLLLDEPLSDLDPILKERLQVEIRKIQRELGITTIYVTHSQAEAFSVSDRVAILEGGRVVQTGTAEELYNEPKNEFVARFVGRGNVFSGLVEEKTEKTSRVRIGDSLLKIRGSYDPGSAVTFTVKPAAIRILDSNDNGAMATVRSITPQIGAYKATMEFNGEPLIALVTESETAAKLRRKRGENIRFIFDPRDTVVLSEEK